VLNIALVNVTNCNNILNLTTKNTYNRGANADGQTGVDSGVLNLVSTPSLVAGVGTVTSVAVSAEGSTFVLVLNNAGTVLVAGSNALGQLGLGSAIPPRRNSFAAITLPAATTATKIAAGGNSILVLGANSKLYGWGANDVSARWLIVVIVDCIINHFIVISFHLLLSSSLQ